MRKILLPTIATCLLLASCAAPQSNINTSTGTIAKSQNPNVILNANSSTTSSGNINMNAVNEYSGWKRITDRSNGVEFMLPKDWSAKMNLVAADDEYIPGRNFIGIYSPVSQQDHVMRIDVYGTSLAEARKANKFLNGTYGRVAKEEPVQINDHTWTKVDYRIKSNDPANPTEMQQTQYLLEYKGKT